MQIRSIEGSIEFEGEEYVYTAQCEQRGKDWYPDRITALDRADGAVLDVPDYEALEALAMQNAWLRKWCGDHGWEIEDSGGGCSALLREHNQKIVRITRDDDPTAPQTMDEPVLLGVYADHDDDSPELSAFPGGIAEIISSPSKSLVL